MSGAGRGSLGTEFEFCKVKRVLDVEVLTAVPLSCALKHLKQSGQFYMLYILPQKKKKDVHAAHPPPGQAQGVPQSVLLLCLKLQKFQNHLHLP